METRDIKPRKLSLRYCAYTCSSVNKTFWYHKVIHSLKFALQVRQCRSMLKRSNIVTAVIAIRNGCTTRALPNTTGSWKLTEILARALRPFVHLSPLCSNSRASLKRFSSREHYMMRPSYWKFIFHITFVYRVNECRVRVNACKYYIYNFFIWSLCVPLI